MRTYHALYKPSTRKNPRRTRGAKANPYPRAPKAAKRRARKNPLDPDLIAWKYWRFEHSGPEWEKDPHSDGWRKTIDGVKYGVHWEYNPDGRPEDGYVDYQGVIYEMTEGGARAWPFKVETGRLLDDEQVLERVDEEIRWGLDKPIQSPNPRKKKVVKRRATRAVRNPQVVSGWRELDYTSTPGDIADWSKVIGGVEYRASWADVTDIGSAVARETVTEVQYFTPDGEWNFEIRRDGDRAPAYKEILGEVEVRIKTQGKPNPASQRKMKAFLRKNPGCDYLYVVENINEDGPKRSAYFEGLDDSVRYARRLAKRVDPRAISIHAFFGKEPGGNWMNWDKSIDWQAEPNPPKKKAAKRKATRRRSNPTSSAGIHQMIADGITKEVESAYKKESGFYASKALAPAGTLLIAPREVLEYGEKTYSGDSAQWRWVNFSNGGTLLGEGVEKTASAAIAEASTALVKWASPLISIVLDRVIKAGKKTDTDRITKAMAKFQLRTFSVDGTKLPTAGKVVTKKGPDRMTVKIFGEKPKASWSSAGDVVWYVQILDDDGNPIGGKDGKKGSGKVGPLLDGVTVDSTVNMLTGLFQGEDDAIEANPIQRKRLNAKARRMTAKKNGIGDWIGGPKRTVKEGRLETSEVGSFEHAVGIPQDPTAAHQIGYYEGILRGINTCKWYPSPSGMWDRYKFRREMRQRYFDAINNLAVDITQAPKKVRRIAKIK